MSKNTCHAAAFSFKVKFDVSRAGGTWKGSLISGGIVRKRRLCTAGRIVAINKKASNRKTESCKLTLDLLTMQVSSQK